MDLAPKARQRQTSAMADAPPANLRDRIIQTLSSAGKGRIQHIPHWQRIVHTLSQYQAFLTETFFWSPSAT